MIFSSMFFIVFLLLFAYSLLQDYRQYRREKIKGSQLSVLVLLNAAALFLVFFLLAGNRPVMPTDLLVKRVAPAIQTYIQEVIGIDQTRR